MKEKLIKILETLGYPVYQQGSYPKDTDYPDNFFTFWNFDTQEIKYYDNIPVKCEWHFWIYFYSNDPSIVNSKLEEARQLLINNGWITGDRGADVASDYITHTGRLIEVIYIEKY